MQRMSRENVALEHLPVGARRLDVVAVAAAGLARGRQAIIMLVHQQYRDVVEQRIRTGFVNLGQIIARGFAQVPS